MDKKWNDSTALRSIAATELESRLPGEPVDMITNSLVFGLSTLRNLLFERVHNDVEANIGHDSMLLPVSATKSEKLAKSEIEAYQIAVSALAAKKHSYIGDDIKWYVGWLLQLQMREQSKESKWRRRIRHYMAGTENQQRLEFSRNLETVFPEASRAPLILYRLIPLSVEIITAIAFRDQFSANELRNSQVTWLPVIDDCHECHGRLLDNGEQCDICGNPLWHYSWLNAAD